MDFEKKINKLETIVTKMESGDLTLEDSLKSFEEGVKLTRECQSQLEDAEGKIKKLIGDNNGSALTEDFDA